MISKLSIYDSNTFIDDEKKSIPFPKNCQSLVSGRKVNINCEDSRYPCRPLFPILILLHLDVYFIDFQLKCFVEREDYLISCWNNLLSYSARIRRLTEEGDFFK